MAGSIASSPPANASSTQRGLVSTAAQVFAGVKTFNASTRGVVSNLTSASAVVAVNLNLGNNFKHTLTENTTLSAPTNAVEGQSGVITLTQGATPYTMALNSFWRFPSGTVPALSTTASAVDNFVYYVCPGGTFADCALRKDIKNTPSTLLVGLINYWKLDGNSTDSIGSGNGTDTAITYNSGNGKINQGAGLDGSTSKISTTAVGPTGVSQRSISAWFKKTGSSDRYVVDYGTAASGQAFSILVSGGLILVSHYGTGTTGVALVTGVWTHAVATYASGVTTLYVNGAAVGTSSATINTGSAQALQIGAGVYAPLNFFDGAIDEVGFWNKALTSTEVTALYNAGTGIQPPF